MRCTCDIELLPLSCLTLALMPTVRRWPILRVTERTHSCATDATARMCKTVVALSRAVAGAHLDGGVLPILKHMPGHGLAQLDSHLDVPRITEDEKYLETHDFAAFRALNDLPMGMTAHLIYEAFDPQPATVSSWMMNLIREGIGFGGLIMTDDISMQALSGTVATRSAAALSAGCDVVLHCNGDLAEMQAVADACGPLRENARKRAQAALDCRCTPNPVDIDALDAQLKALLSGQEDSAGVKPVSVEERLAAEALIVDVDGFEGPLDLLLTLSRTQKVDLRKVSVLQLAQQYLVFVEKAQALRIELAADYLVMAAWLAFLKSRLLLPPDPEEEGPSGEELAAHLAFQLERLQGLCGIWRRV
ncbi:Beta-hexosaminidase [Nymphon striatum]|nr:Beta-hexosaminidase [Nymphon striatum]